MQSYCTLKGRGQVLIQYAILLFRADLGVQGYRRSYSDAGGRQVALGVNFSLQGLVSVFTPLLPRCPYLHRTTGDTERKYHLRYYKTGTCIHETDARGHCVKNGLHCAFAHGPLDLRPPVCDIR